MQSLDQAGLIALAFVIVIGLTLVLAIFRYRTVEDVLKLWGGLGSIATAIATFYFTNNVAQKRVDATERDKQAVAEQLKQTEQKYARLSENLLIPQQKTTPLQKESGPVTVKMDWGRDMDSHILKLAPFEPTASLWVDPK